MKSAVLVLNSRIESLLASLNSVVQAFNKETERTRRLLDECSRRDRELEERIFELTDLVNRMTRMEDE